MGRTDDGGTPAHATTLANSALPSTEGPLAVVPSTSMPHQGSVSVNKTPSAPALALGVGVGVDVGVKLTVLVELGVAAEDLVAETDGDAEREAVGDCDAALRVEDALGAAVCVALSVPPGDAVPYEGAAGAELSADAVATPTVADGRGSAEVPTVAVPGTLAAIDGEPSSDAVPSVLAVIVGVLWSDTVPWVLAVIVRVPLPAEALGKELDEGAAGEVVADAAAIGEVPLGAVGRADVVEDGDAAVEIDPGTSEVGAAESVASDFDGDGETTPERDSESTAARVAALLLVANADRGAASVAGGVGETRGEVPKVAVGASDGAAATDMESESVARIENPEEGERGNDTEKVGAAGSVALAEAEGTARREGDERVEREIRAAALEVAATEGRGTALDPRVAVLTTEGSARDAAALGVPPAAPNAAETVSVAVDAGVANSEPAPVPVASAVPDAEGDADADGDALEDADGECDADEDPLAVKVSSADIEALAVEEMDDCGAIVTVPEPPSRKLVEETSGEVPTVAVGIAVAVEESVGAADWVAVELCSAEAVEFALPDELALAVGEMLSLVDAVAEGDPECVGRAVLGPVLVGDDVADRDLELAAVCDGDAERVVVGVTVRATERDTVEQAVLVRIAVRVADAVGVKDGLAVEDGVAVTDGDVEGDGDREDDAVAEVEPEEVADSDALDETVDTTDEERTGARDRVEREVAVDDRECREENEGVALKLRARIADTEITGVAVMLAELDALALLVALPEPEDEAVTDTVTVPTAEVEGVCETVASRHTEGVSVTERVDAALVVRERVAAPLRDEPALREEAKDALVVLVEDTEAHAEDDVVGDAQGEAESLPAELVEREGDEVSDGDAVTEAVGEAEREAVAHREFVDSADADRIDDEVTDDVCVELRENEGEEVAEEDSVTRLGVGERDNELGKDRDSERLGDPEPDPTKGEGDSDASRVNLPVVREVEEAERDAIVRDTASDRVGRMPVWLGDGTSDREPENVFVDDTAGLSVPGVDDAATREGDSVPLARCEALVVVHSERVGEPLIDAHCVAAPDCCAVEESETVADSDGIDTDGKAVKLSCSDAPKLRVDVLLRAELMDDVCVDDCPPVFEGDTVPHEEELGDTLGEKLPLPLGLCVTLELDVGLVEPLALAVDVCVVVAHPVYVPETVAERDGADEREGDRVPLPVRDRVGEPEKVRRATVGVARTLRSAVTLATGDVKLVELALGEAVAVAVAVPRRVTVVKSLGTAPREAPKDTVDVSVERAANVPLTTVCVDARLPDELAVDDGDTVSDGDADADCDSVVLAVSLELPEMEGLADELADGVLERDARAEAVEAAVLVRDRTLVRVGGREAVGDADIVRRAEKDLTGDVKLVAVACNGVALASSDPLVVDDGASELLVETTGDAETPSDCEDERDGVKLAEVQSDGDGDGASETLSRAVVLGMGDVPSVPEERGEVVAVTVGVADGCAVTDESDVLDGNAVAVAEGDTTRLVKGEGKGERDSDEHGEDDGAPEVLGSELALGSAVAVAVSDGDDVADTVTFVEAVAVSVVLASADRVECADAVLRAVPVTPPPAPPRPELAVAAATDCVRLADARCDERGETLEVADGDAVADAHGEALGQDDADALPESVDDGEGVMPGDFEGEGVDVAADVAEELRETRDDSEPVAVAVKAAVALGDPVGEGDVDVDEVADALCVGDGDEDAEDVVEDVLVAESDARLRPDADATELRDRDGALLREGVDDTVLDAETVDESVDVDVAVSKIVALALDDALVLGDALVDPDGLPDPDEESVLHPERVAAGLGRGATVMDAGRGVAERGGVNEAVPEVVDVTDGDGERVVCGESVTSMDVPFVPVARGDRELDGCSVSEAKGEGEATDRVGDSDWSDESDTVWTSDCVCTSDAEGCRDAEGSEALGRNDRVGRLVGVPHHEPEDEGTSERVGPVDALVAEESEMVAINDDAPGE